MNFSQVVEFIRTHSVPLSELLRQIMYVGLAFEFLRWNDQQQAVVLAALSGLFSLFTSKQTIASTKVDAIVDKAIERVGTATESGMFTKPPNNRGKS